MKDTLSPSDPSADAELWHGGWFATAPAWLLSLIAHLALGISGGLLFRGLAAGPPVDESPRSAEIVLTASRDVPPRPFADEEAAGRHEALKPVVALSQEAGLATATGDLPPMLAGINLPTNEPISGLSSGIMPNAPPRAGGGRPRLSD